MFTKPSTRELVMETRQRLDDHVRSCTEASNRTQEALKKLAEGLMKSSEERTKQFEKLNSMMWKVMLWVIGGLFGAVATVVLPAIHVHLGN